MRYLSLLFLPILLISCKKDSVPTPQTSSFAGQYFYAAKHHESGNYGAMDLIISVSDKAEVRIEDDFADPADLGAAKVSGNVLTATQHVDSGYDTRDITLTMTKEGSIMKFVYDVDFTQSGGDYHLEGILTRQ